MTKTKTWGGAVGTTPAALGIDQSYSGFALAAVTETGYYIQVSKLEGSGVDRLKHAQTLVLSFMDYVEKMTGHPISEVAMEGYAFGSQMSHMAGELGGAVKLALDSRKTTPKIAPPSVVKKYATSKGNAKKQEIILHVYKKWGLELLDDNAADAYVLARMAHGFADNKYEQEALQKMSE